MVTLQRPEDFHSFAQLCIRIDGGWQARQQKKARNHGPPAPRFYPNISYRVPHPVMGRGPPRRFQARATVTRQMTARPFRRELPRKKLPSRLEAQPNIRCINGQAKKLQNLGLNGDSGLGPAVGSFSHQSPEPKKQGFLTKDISCLHVMNQLRPRLSSSLELRVGHQR